MASGAVAGGRLLVIGDVVTDVVARHAQPLAPGTDTEAAIEVRPGGSGANTAAWAAHCGADVTMLARVGEDGARWHERELARCGVRPRLRVDRTLPTARVIVLVDATGERTMVTDRGAGGRLAPDDWDDALLDGTAMLHLSGYTLFTASGRQLAAVALAAAGSRGVPVSVDPASTGFLGALGVPRFLAATRGCAVVLPNEEEAALLSGEADPERAAVRLSGWYGLAVVKLGSRGALAARDGELAGRCPAPEVEVVDSTGAGDAFTGGFLAATLAGAGTADATAAGCASGARAVTAVGGRPPHLTPGVPDTDAPAVTTSGPR